MVTFENVGRVTHETSRVNQKMCNCLFRILDQTTMAQEQRCLTFLPFDLSFFFNPRAFCCIGIVSFVFIVSTIMSSSGITEDIKKR